jgi:nitrogenase molybdenum-iron protein beta chain
MPQNPEKIQDHVELFHQPEYQQLFENKKQFEAGNTGKRTLNGQL